MSEGIIDSLLDTDLYKLTMMQCILHHYPSLNVKYKLLYRYQIQLSEYAELIEEEISKLCNLRFTEAELKYLSSLNYIKPDFISFLKNFKLNDNYVKVEIKDNLEITISGPWLHTIMFEVPILAIICETYYRDNVPNPDFTEGKKRLENKIKLVKNLKDNKDFKFTDFGTRRRFSKDWHFNVVKTFADNLPENFIGTSNVKFAKGLDITPVGTMAHEYLQAFQAISPRLEHSQKQALKVWLNEYEGQLGIALTDVITMDAFFKDFDHDLAIRYSGIRNDSGDPLKWAEKAIKHYEHLGINPKTKALVFSNTLDIPTAINIYENLKNKTKIFFGIGTNLTNDLGYKSLDLIIKMTEANGKPVAKISDSLKKTVCTDESYLKRLKKAFNIKNSK